MSRIVLAYSGGVNTTVAIPWLHERDGADVIAVTLDLGQPCQLELIRERALASGALRAHVLDVRDEFATDFLLPALQAGALSAGRDPLATSLGRPLIARTLVEIAALEQADAIAHGCADDRDAVRLEAPAGAIAPAMRVIAPVREWAMTRPEAIAYAKARGIRVPAEEICTVAKSPAGAPAEPAYVELRFDRGVPAEVNGIAMPLTELIASLETIAGVHGGGRAGPAVLQAACRELESLVLPHDLQRLKRQLTAAYVDLIDKGQWFTPSREAIDAFVGRVQQSVTGIVRVELWKGECRVVDRTSPFALGDRQPVRIEALSQV